MRTRRHRFRAIRNLLAALLLLALPWYALGAPLPTREMALHRSERVCLIDPSTVVFACESESEGERMIGDPVMLVGVSKRTVQTSSRTHRFNVWPKNPDGATLVVLPSELEYDPVLVVGLVAVGPPALAERAKLTMDLTAYEQGMVCTAEGKRKGAAFLFRLEEADADAGYHSVLDNLFHTTDLQPYTLEFFDKDGKLLETVTNIDDQSWSSASPDP